MKEGGSERGSRTRVGGRQNDSERSEGDGRGARGTFKEWQRKLTQSCSAWQCRLKSSGFEECAERRWGMCSSYLAI